jgi:hypothetical protein
VGGEPELFFALTDNATVLTMARRLLTGLQIKIQTNALELSLAALIEVGDISCDPLFGSHVQTGAAEIHLEVGLELEVRVVLQVIHTFHEFRWVCEEF